MKSIGIKTANKNEHENVLWMHVLLLLFFIAIVYLLRLTEDDLAGKPLENLKNVIIWS